MKDVTAANFGLLIAFLLPGFVTLWGIGEFSPTIHGWFTGAPEQSPSVGGFLYVTLGAIAAGLFVSTLRWLLIDTIHHRTGIAEPKWNFAVLNRQLPTFELLVASHYRFYQAYANLIVAVLVVFISVVITRAPVRAHIVATAIGLAAVEAVLWLGSRDTLRKYYRRAEVLMAEEGNDLPEDAHSGHSVRQKESGPLGNPGKGRLKIEGPFR